MFKAKQKVWCAIYGAGVVEEILHTSKGFHPVVVRFKSTRLAAYTSDGRYTVDGDVTLYTYPIEIVKAAVKPSIDWSHVSPEYGYLFQDSDGEGYLYCDKPHVSKVVENGWDVESHYIYANLFTSYEPGTCDWTDSLVKRPELVQEI